MKLHAVLCWWNESPTWLSATVASLTRIGVDHLIAVDGRYPHFQPDRPHLSEVDQVDAITNTAYASGIACTLHQPLHALTEAQKRTRGFQLVEMLGTVHDDWVLVIDADEVLIQGSTHGVKANLEALPSNMHAVQVGIDNTTDVYAAPSHDNGVTEATNRIYRTMNVDETVGHLQSRLFRVMKDMRSHVTHFNYVGVDADGVEWNIRPDIGVQNLPGMPVTEIGRIEHQPTMLHRKNQRSVWRQEQKKAYYNLRDEIGLERV